MENLSHGIFFSKKSLNWNIFQVEKIFEWWDQIKLWEEKRMIQVRGWWSEHFCYPLIFNFIDLHHKLTRNKLCFNFHSFFSSVQGKISHKVFQAIFLVKKERIEDFQRKFCSIFISSRSHFSSFLLFKILKFLISYAEPLKIFVFDIRKISSFLGYFRILWWQKIFFWILKD